MPSEQELMQQIESYAEHLNESVAAIQYWHDRTLEQAQQAYDRKLAEIRTHYEHMVAQAQQTLNQAEQAAGLWAVSWDAPAWRTFRPSPDLLVPRFTRIGVLTEPGPEGQLEVPALLPIVGGQNVVLKATGAAMAQANQATQAVMLRLLATLPPGKLRFTLIDPVDRGRNMAGFMHLADYLETLVDRRVWTEADHIRQRLENITSHMDMVIQKYLRNQYPTMEAYNAEAGEVEEPYRLVVVANFPANFTEETARRLVSIARSGPSCGVYVLATVDTEMKLPHGFNLADLEGTATLITPNGGHFVWQEDGFQECVLMLDTLPPAGQFDRIVHAVGREAQTSSKVEVPFNRIVPASEAAWWAESTDRELCVPVGLVGARKIQCLELGRGTAQHALVAGKTGSGKSTLFHVLITSLALTYSPDEVMVYLIDFKKGVEFKDYAIHQLPHARVIAIQSEREFGLSVLEGLDAELQRRGDLLREAGCANLSEYRSQTGRRMPRLLLLVDEFQEFFSEDDTLAQRASLILDRLVRQGRAFGVHVLLGSQSLAGVYTLARSTVDQMAVRIALQCSDADSRLILSDENDAARLLGRPGEAIYNAANGLVEGNVRFQAVWLSDEEREAHLRQIRAYAERTGYEVTCPPIVFEGNEPARIEANQDLVALLTADHWLPCPGVVSAWLGEPIAIQAHHTAARFRRQSRSNLLIVGHDESAAAGMLIIALLSLAAQHQPEEACFYVLDLSSADGSAYGLARQVAATLPHQVKVARRRREIGPLIEELAQLVETRLEQDVDEESGPEAYLVILGLHQARDLRREESDMGWHSASFDEPAPPPSPAERFATVIRDGPDVGVHTLAWCNSYASLERTLERRGIAEFDMRVAMQMSADGSTQLVDSPLANKLGPNRAFFYDEEQIGRLEKFRPYAPPAPDWLTWVGEQLQKRKGGNG